MKKILITGGSGFLGKNLAYKFRRKHKIYIASRNLEKGLAIEKKFNVNFVPLNISSYQDVEEVLFNIKPNIIIHAAASKFVDLSEKFPSETIDTNINGSKNIFTCAKKFNCKKIIVISSDKASPPFTSLYALSKATMERAMIDLNSDNKLDLNFLRFGNLPWSTGSVLNLWNEMRSKKIIGTTGPEMTRFFFNLTTTEKLIEYLIKNGKGYNNKIIIPEMKSLKIKDLLMEFCNKYKVKWKKIKKRKMDKNYETLIPEGQYYKTKFLSKKIGKVFILDLKKNVITKNKEINSKNSKKFSKKEIKNIINNKPNFL